MFLTIVLNAALLEFIISFSVILRLTYAWSFCAFNTSLTSSSSSFFNMFCKKLILLLFKLYLTGIAPVSLYRVRMWLYLSNRKINWMIFYLRAHRLHLYPTYTLLFIFRLYDLYYISNNLWKQFISGICNQHTLIVTLLWFIIIAPFVSKWKKITRSCPHRSAPRHPLNLKRRNSWNEYKITLESSLSNFIYLQNLHTKNYATCPLSVIPLHFQNVGPKIWNPSEVAPQPTLPANCASSKCRCVTCCQNRLVQRVQICRV